MNKKLIAVGIVVTLQVIMIVYGVTRSSAPAPSWDQALTSVTKVQADADAMLANPPSDPTVCAAATVTSSLAGVLKGSLDAVKAGGACDLQAVEVDASTCVPAAPAEPVTETVPAELVTETAPAVEVTSVVEADPAPTAEDQVFGLIFAAVKAEQDAAPQVQAWSAGAAAWLEAAKPLLSEVLANPSKDKVSVPGFSVEGC